MPDLMLLKDGKTFFIECKAEKGRLSELQKYRHEQLEEEGFRVYTIYKMDEIKFITKWLKQPTTTQIKVFPLSQ